LAVQRDHQFIEPLHLMTALLDQQGGTVCHLLQLADVNVNALRAGLGEQPARLRILEGVGST
jgi:ATP-dependent Clp protease ATP-binding subunit ClpB